MADNNSVIGMTPEQLRKSCSDQHQHVTVETKVHVQPKEPKKLKICCQVHSRKI